MGNFMVNVLIWSFSIYGLIDFIKEIWLDIIMAVVKGIKYLKKSIKWIAKKAVELYNK